MKIFNKKIIKIIGIILGVLFIYYIAMIGPEIWKSYQWQKSVEKWEEAQRKPFEEDIYGGKTPEETWAMFLNALKKGDLDLASKYHDVEHQAEAKKWLEDLKKNNELEQTIKEMETLEKDSQPLFQDRVHYSYKFYDKETKQQLWSTTVFYLNPSTKVWKILF